jgi:hypothetical protein
VRPDPICCKAVNSPCTLAKKYFNKFGIDIATVLQPDQGPDVYFSNMSDYGYYNEFTNNIVVNENILNNPQAIASTLIHETGHCANDVATIFGDLNPDISDMPSFDNPNPDDGPYGYLGEISTFGYIY